MHTRIAPGLYAPRPGQPKPTLGQESYTARLLGRCEQIGPELRTWATEALEERGIRAIRLIQGVLDLTRRHPREHVLRAALMATEHRLFRYRDLCRLADIFGARKQTPLISDHPSIRPITEYRLEDLV